MDLLEDPEIKDTYNKCKYIVKLWEHNFKKAHKRLPSRLDIKEADREVRDAYKKYYQLKTAALEQSFKDVEGFNFDDENSSAQVSQTEETRTEEKQPEIELSKEGPAIELSEQVWGHHLDNKTETDKPIQSASTKSKPSLNSSISKKLFCGSKFSKRNPRKALSYSQKNKSETNFDGLKFLSQPSTSSGDTGSSVANLSQTDNNRLSFEGLFSNNKVNILEDSEKRTSQSINLVQTLLENKNKTLKTVDPGWLERIELSTGVEIEKRPEQSVYDNINDESHMNLGYDSDDIIDNSDEENSINLGPFAKKPKISFTQLLNVPKRVPDESFEQFNEGIRKEVVDININKEMIKEQESQNKEELGMKLINSSNFLDEKTSSDIIPGLSSFQTIKKQIRKNESDLKSIKKRRVTKKKSTCNSKTEGLRRSSRSTKVQTTMTESHSENEDPFHSDNNSDDPEFIVNKDVTNKMKQILIEENPVDEPSGIKKKSKRGRKPKEIHQEQIEDDNSSTTYELEYSIKPRVSAPRFKNIKKLIKEQKSNVDVNPKEDKQPVKKSKQFEKLEKKIKSSSLNENFVTINLKKKIYVRGKKNMNFSTYKKQLWKNKKKTLAGPDMDMGGCDGGMLTCFKCGDIGHFARQCPKSKGDGLLPLQTDEEACPFPTLEEAAQMAKESVLAVRKPNMQVDKNDEKSQENKLEPNKNETVERTELETESQELSDDSDDDLFDETETEHLLAETLKLEEEAAKLDLQLYLDYVKVVEPYYKLNDDCCVIATPKEVFVTLEKFGHSSFRPGQEQAIMRILSGKSTLVTLSTGSGKSLIYQLPAYLYSRREPCISLVISPLVSLMEDQVTGIPLFLKAACLHTNQTKTQREKVLEAISSGNLNILLVSPEAIVAGERSTGFGSLLRKLPPIAFACIDEAHCVSQWSHNFRPSYLMICRVLRERMGVKTVLGLTATATRSTRDSIISHLQIADGNDGVISDIPLPDNLILTVSKDYQRDQALLGLLTSERFVNCKSIIIYCTRRDECDRVTRFLRTSLQYSVTECRKRKRISVQAEPYHAGLSASKRKTIQKAFMSGELRIVVATVAFGMGINKSDIRAVIHYNMPKNFESYVQEVGRAGRDGLPAHCHLFLDSKGKDENELRRHIHANSIDRHVIRKLLQKIFLPCSCKEVCPKHEVAFSIEETVRTLDIPEENISTLLCYLELHENRYIELLSPAYTVCKVISYGGPIQIRKAAKECPPLAMALALQKNQTGGDQNVLEFAVIDIAAAIGWDSGICKHKLKNLEWITVNGQPKRSSLTIQFSNLGFRLLAPGNLSDDELDNALDSLYDHVVKQEKTSLLQLRAVHQTLIQSASPSYKSHLSAESSGSEVLKSKIREYFESSNPLDSISLEDNQIIDEEAIISSIRGLISTYKDNNFTGRAVARIFHGIPSPNYPAVIWGRCKYWRSYINFDFHAICKLATKEILSFR